MTSNWIFWTLAAAVIGFSVWSLLGLRRDPERHRAAWLAGLRGTAAILLAWIVLQPQFRRQEAVAERPIVGVLIDASQSMNDGPSSTPRSAVAREWLDSAAMRKARETCDLRYFSITQNLAESVPGDIGFNGTASSINLALDEWVRRYGHQNAAGLVLLSDGLDTSGGPPVSLGLPCWVMEVEPPGPAIAARVTIWQVEPPRHAIAGAETSVRIVLQGWGVEGKDIPVELWSEGRKLTEKRVANLIDGQFAA